jgi:hypothetical protein
MKKEFVPYEQALALKELGFYEPCFGFYNNADGNVWIKHAVDESIKNIYTGDFEAPLYQQAFRFFREKYKINGHFWDCSTPAGPWCFTVKKLDENMYKSLFVCEKCRFKTPEEAELECIKKLIEIVKK